jgi:serine/threonine protein kinase
MTANEREQTKVLGSSEDERDEAPLPDSAPRFGTGTLLNERYEIVKLLGRGGMGEVYLASDTRINRSVTLKVIHADLVSNKESVHRFTLEAQAVSALNHPHILTIYEIDSTGDGDLFFVAEYVDGQTLNHLIGSDLDVDKALDIAIQVTSALTAAHEAGIIHRDIKPENIMVRRDGYVKVLDFGLAKLAQRPKSGSTSSGSEDPTIALNPTSPGAVVGTAAYMSPEQARGRHVDERTEIWSLGAVIYEMLTRRRAFPGETSADILVSVLSKEPPALSGYGSSLAPELEWVVTKTLSKDVEGRYQTAKDLRADLERIRKQIDLNKSLNRSPGRSVDSNGGAPLTFEAGTATAPEVARPTSGVRDPAPHQGFWSAPVLTGALERARTHKMISVVMAVVVAGLILTAVYFGFVAGSGSGIDSIAVLPFRIRAGTLILPMRRMVLARV